MEHIALLMVKSQIKTTSPYTWNHLNSWYDDELINDFLNLPVPHRSRTILRYKNVASSVEYPYVALYPLMDMRLLHGPISNRLTAKLRDQPTKAFGGDKAFEHIDFQNVSYRCLDSLENELFAGEDREYLPLTMMTDVFPLPDGPSRLSGEARFKADYRLPGLIEKSDNYLRSLRYKLLSGNPHYFVIHYFNCDPSMLGQDVLTAGADVCTKREVYFLVRAGGNIQYPRTELQPLASPEPLFDTSEAERTPTPTRGSFSTYSSTI